MNYKSNFRPIWTFGIGYSAVATTRLAAEREPNLDRPDKVDTAGTSLRLGLARHSAQCLLEAHLRPRVHEEDGVESSWPQKRGLNLRIG